MRSSPAGKVHRNKPLSNFREKVLRIVARIPRGKLLSYGHVAAMAGSPRAARIVGGILFKLGPNSHHPYSANSTNLLRGWSKSSLAIPWQRVVNARGGISTYRVGSGEKQLALLKKEGIIFNAAGHADLKRYQWWPSPRLLKTFEVNEDLAAAITLRADW